ncbi:MAG: DUF547 domain-containing protein [Thermodesulfobacteriota bacterium]
MKPYFSSFIVIILFVLLLSNQLVNADALDQSNEQYAKVLNTYVKDGLVDYAGLKSNPKNLNQYLEQTASINEETFKRWSKNEQLAFLINLYNAQTLDLIAGKYPVKSIKDIASNSGGPWEQPIVTLFGEKITLNALENEVIRKNYLEPRIHFALVCAAMGCPKIINKSYQASILDKQLDQQTRVFLMDSDKNSIDTNNRVLRLSPIFDWFQEDFSKESGSVIEFVNPYFGNEATREFRIEYTDYSWTLNDLSSKKN